MYRLLLSSLMVFFALTAQGGEQAKFPRLPNTSIGESLCLLELLNNNGPLPQVQWENQKKVADAFLELPIISQPLTAGAIASGAYLYFKRFNAAEKTLAKASPTKEVACVALAGTLALAALSWHGFEKIWLRMPPRAVPLQAARSL